PFREIRQEFPVLLPPLGIVQRDLLAGGSGLPDAEEPHHVEPVFGDPVVQVIWHVIERGRSPALARERCQKDTGVDLKERWVRSNRFCFPAGAHLSNPSTKVLLGSPGFVDGWSHWVLVLRAA